MIVRNFFGTGGVFTPRHGCRRVIWSLNAVVNTADRMVWHCRITVGDAPAAFRSDTHSRTSAGWISLIHIDPKTGRMCLFEVVGVGLAGAGLHLVVRQPPVFDVAAEPLPRPPGIAGPAVCLPVLGPLPRPGGFGFGDKRARGAAVALHVVIECLVAHTAVRPGPFAYESHGCDSVPADLQGGPVLSLICHPNCLSGAVMG